MTNGRVEVITSVQRRRRWPFSDKERIVAASLEPGANASDVARAAGIHTSQLYRWRRELCERAGLKENFGSMTKPYHAGHAARNGVWAAQLAREGFTASDTALDGKQGYATAFGGSAPIETTLGSLGRAWQLVASGIAVKPYPSCALTHSAIDALLDLRRRHRLSAGQVAAVDVGVHRVVPTVLIHARPTTALERKFSMQFCAAAALGQGRVDVASFTDGAVVDEGVRDLMSRVTMTVDPALPDTLEQHAWTRVSLRLADGRTITSPPRGASGHPGEPLTEGELRAKFLGCAAGVIPAEDAEGLAAEIANLEGVPDVRALTARLVADVE
jgi:2-methylcitrate dehydratase PrpD